MKTKKLELRKLKIAKLDNLQTIKGGSIIFRTIIVSYNPEDCAGTTGCPSHTCPGTTIIRR